MNIGLISGRLGSGVPLVTKKMYELIIETDSRVKDIYLIGCELKKDWLNIEGEFSHIDNVNEKLHDLLDIKLPYLLIIDDSQLVDKSILINFLKKKKNNDSSYVMLLSQNEFSKSLVKLSDYVISLH